MIEKIIHFVLVKRKPNKAELEIFEIAKKLNPGWKVIIWDETIPEEGFPLSHYRKRAKSGAQLADLIRLEVVYKFGGIYIDSDMRLVKSLQPISLLDNFFCSEDGSNLTNAAFGAKKESLYIKRLIDSLLTNEPDWEKPPNITTGPVLFAKELQWEPGINILPRETFYPYNFNEPVCMPLVTTYGVHEWAGSWLPKEKSSNRAHKSVIDILLLLRNRIRAKVKLFLCQVIRISLPILIEAMPRTGTVYTFGRDLIAKTSRGLIMSLAGSDLSITPQIALTGTYEEVELIFVEKTLRGGDFFVDVGCNVGLFALVAAKCVGPFGRVFAFDENHGVLNHLKRSLLINRFHDRVKVFHAEVGDRDQMAILKNSKLRLGDTNIGLDDGSAIDQTIENLGDFSAVDVPMLALDLIFPHPLEIKIMKVDVGGFEYNVLDSAISLIQKKAINYILLKLPENNAPAQFKKNIEAVRFILKQGYEIGRVVTNGTWQACKSIDEVTRLSRNIALKRI